MTAAILSDPEAGTLPVIDFVAPLPGFPEDLRFVLVQVHEEGLLYALTSLDSEGLRFLVAPPAPFFPDYAPEVDEETLAALGTADPADLLTLLVISAGESAREATANLLAPIVFDQSTRRATQLVLAGSGLPVREPLLVPRA
ncbi:MAG: flagellar assembly protein FliW [Micromonosporaceae bacterium]|nr:flagellar assembly protein FliW [Micromonosporaceae bacterium]